MTRERQFKQDVLKAVFAYKDLIDTHRANCDYAHEIAEQHGITRNLLQRSFKKQVGLTIREYKLNLRMDHSRTLLESGIGIKEVSVKLNYTTQRAFSHAFKKHFGTTPNTYVNSLPDND